MDRMCPICQNKMEEDQRMQGEKLLYSDYRCFPSQPDHHYCERISGQDILKLKVRISTNDERWFLKINFDDGFSEIWTKPSDETSRVRINHTFTPNLQDLDGLLKKLKTYITFS